MRSPLPLVPALPTGILDDASDDEVNSNHSSLSNRLRSATVPTRNSFEIPAAATDDHSPSSEVDQLLLSPIPNNIAFLQTSLCDDRAFEDTFSSTGVRTDARGIAKQSRYNYLSSEEGEITHEEDTVGKVGKNYRTDMKVSEMSGEDMFEGSSFSGGFDMNNDKDNIHNSDEFKVEVDAMLTALEDLPQNRKGGIPRIGTRVAIERLDEKENPLEKEGRNTVIRGRFRDDHPFATAARCLGYKLVSPRYNHLSLFGEQSDLRDDRERMGLFLLDCNAVYKFLKGKDIKVPIIGGGPLNMFKLQQEVLLLGGLQNVVEKRAFRIVAQQLELPSTCTSAAYVLKGTYERFLYHYEQLLVYGKWPADANETVNMKNLVSASRERERERERRTSRLTSFRERRRGNDGNSTMQMDDGTSVEDAVCRRIRRVAGNSDDIRECDPPAGISTSSARALKDFMAASSTNLTATWNFYCQLTGEEGGELSLPRWGLELPSEDAQMALIRTALNVEKRGQGKFDIKENLRQQTISLSLEGSGIRFQITC